MLAFKLLRKRRDQSLGPLFINKTQRVPVGVWLKAGFFPTKGYKPRGGWHCTLKPVAPHLSKKGRVWCLVDVRGITLYNRPASQGGTWVLANKMRVMKELE